MDGERDDVSAEELFETVEEESMDGRVLPMPCAERTERSEVAIG